MLSDIERKVLRIISNFSTIRGRVPTINELSIKTGRSYNGILNVLSTLNGKGYIKWDRKKPEDIEILQAWEMKYD